MTRLIIMAIIFICLFIIETSFMSSLPLVFRSIQLMLFLGLVILHIFDRPIGMAWLIIYGLSLDVLGLSSTGGSVIIMLILALVAVFLSKNLFVNKNFYSTVGYFSLLALIVSLLDWITFRINGLSTAESNITLIANLSYQAISIIAVSIIFYLVAGGLLTWLNRLIVPKFKL